jgi:hypothetical protein
MARTGDPYRRFSRGAARDGGRDDHPVRGINGGGSELVKLARQHAGAARHPWKISPRSLTLFVMTGP